MGRYLGKERQTEKKENSARSQAVLAQSLPHPNVYSVLRAQNWGEGGE